MINVEKCFKNMVLKILSFKKFLNIVIQVVGILDTTYKVTATLD